MAKAKARFTDKEGNALPTGDNCPSCGNPDFKTYTGPDGKKTVKCSECKYVDTTATVEANVEA